MSLIEGEKIPTFDHIINNIYLGDREGVLSKSLLDKHNIKIIINISNTRYDEYENRLYYHFDIDDNKNEDISIFFNQFMEIINENNDKNIYIHCMNSVSRSVTLVLYYLLQSMNLHDSFVYLKSKRTQYTKPNSGFIKQLLTAEKN